MTVQEKYLLLTLKLKQAQETAEELMSELSKLKASN